MLFLSYMAFINLKISKQTVEDRIYGNPLSGPNIDRIKSSWNIIINMCDSYDSNITNIYNILIGSFKSSEVNDGKINSRSLKAMISDNNVKNENIIRRMHSFNPYDENLLINTYNKQTNQDLYQCFNSFFSNAEEQLNLLNKKGGIILDELKNTNNDETHRILDPLTELLKHAANNLAQRFDSDKDNFDPTHRDYNYITLYFNMAYDFISCLIVIMTKYLNDQKVNTHETLLAEYEDSLENQLKISDYDFKILKDEWTRIFKNKLSSIDKLLQEIQKYDGIYNIRINMNDNEQFINQKKRK